jgi:hypothetical protein
LEGKQTREQQEANRERDDARANLTTIINFIKDSKKSWGEVDDSLKSQIRALEVKGGMPQGITEAFISAKPGAELLAHTTGYDAAGNEMVTFIYKDPATGKVGMTETVKTGAVKEAAVSTSAASAAASLGIAAKDWDKFNNEFQAEYDKAIKGTYGTTGVREKVGNAMVVRFPQYKTQIWDIIYGNASKGIQAMFPSGWEAATNWGAAAQKRFITKDYLKTLFATYSTDQMLKAMGKTRDSYKVWYKTAAGEEQTIRDDFDKWLDTLMNIIEQYRKAGKSDDEILKLMQ